MATGVGAGGVSLPEPRYSQSLERGIAIMRCFTPERPVLGVAAMPRELWMSRGTTHRYVITLVALCYMVQGEKRKYRLGLAVINLGMSALSSTSLREHARPYLEELRGQAGYTVNIAVLDGPEVLYVDRLRGFRGLALWLGGSCRHACGVAPDRLPSGPAAPLWRSYRHPEANG
jgi:IclR family pca regulon transcriptional regulator